MTDSCIFNFGILFLVGLVAAVGRGSSPTSADVNKLTRHQTGLVRHPAMEPIGHLSEKVVDVVCPECEISRPPIRSKRCTCYSYKDKECVYYCHRGIIWINTPDVQDEVGRIAGCQPYYYTTCSSRRTVPYGESNYRGLQRIRRSSRGMAHSQQSSGPQRCQCRDHTDSSCSSFCGGRWSILSQPAQLAPKLRHRDQV